MKKKNLTYKTKDIFTVEEISYSDGMIRYNVKGKDKHGTFDVGPFNDIDLLIEVMEQIGKIKTKAIYV